VHSSLTAIVIGALVLATLGCAAMPANASGPASIVREVLDQGTRRSGSELAERHGRAVAERSIESAVKRYGPQAAAAIADGGTELLEAGTRYGDDVIRFAVEASPAGRQALVLDAGNLVPLIRELGPSALEIEAHSPGLGRQVFTIFGPDGAHAIAKSVPADDVPRLIAYAQRADCPQTRKILLETYEREGQSMFDRIPPKLIFAGGLSTAMLYGTHRLTAPAAAIGDRITHDPDLARRTVDWMAVLGGGLLLLLMSACLYRFGLLRRPQARRA